MHVEAELAQESDLSAALTQDEVAQEFVTAPYLPAVMGGSTEDAVSGRRKVSLAQAW